MKLNQSLAKVSILLLILISSLSSCVKTDKKTRKIIGFSQCVGSDMWRKAMLEEMKMELSLHPEAKFIYKDAGGNSEKQVKQVKELLKDNIDLLIISPNEAQPLTKIVEQVYNDGVPVVVIDRKTSSSLYTAYVGADNYELGKMAAQYLATLFKDKKIRLIEIMGLPGSSPAIERDRGFEDGVKNFKLIQIKTKIYGDWVAKNARSQLLSIKDKLQDVDAVFAQNDVMAGAAREVFNHLHHNKNIKIVGIDALPGKNAGLQLIENKVIDASLVYPTGGKEAIATAFHILNNEPFVRQNTLQSLVVDSTNVQLMEMQWNKIKNQQTDIERQQTLLKEQQTIYKNQQFVLNSLLIALVMAVVFGGLAFFSLTENRKINKSLAHKNEEILSQRNQLIAISAKAEAATEAKLNFFTQISHEFRTPLTLMLSPTEDLLKNENLSFVEQKNIRLIHQNIFRLLMLVNQLIDYRKIEYDGQKIKASENDIVAFVKEIVSSFSSYTEKINKKIQFYANEKKINLWFDPNILDKVFFNLIANAIKFSSDYGIISVRIKADQESVIIEVEDNGIGIEANDLPFLFDQFYQVNQSHNTGSGIGLSLSKEIVELHHGKIAVRSEKGFYTIFTVKLPLGQQHLQEEEKTNVLSEGWSNIQEKAKLYKTVLDKVITNPLKESQSFIKEFTLLIVEDNIELLEYLEDKFTAYFNVHKATNGMQALADAFDYVPDLIISDMIIPGITGKDLTEKLKADLRTSHIPIILLTAQGSLDQQISGIKSKADLYLTKPFNFDFLLANVQNLIANRLMLKEHFSSDISSNDHIYNLKPIDRKFLNDLAGIVEENLPNEKFAVDDICKIIGISRVQLYRKVKALLGKSIIDYILDRRLKKAKYLLLNENYNISEITYMVGFSNPNYFSTVFKTKYNATPSEFKKLHNG